MKEVKKIVTGTTGNSYSVSNYGYVETHKTYVVFNGVKYPRKHTRLNGMNNGKGYLYIQIGKGVENRRYIHRLVAELFIPNPDNLPQVNHKDGDKSNNHVENLEWVTAMENSIHATKFGLRKVGAEAEGAIKVFTTDGMVFGCIKDAAKHFDINYGTLKYGLRNRPLYRGMYRADKILKAC